MAQLLFGSGFLWGERTDKKELDPVTGKLIPAHDIGPIQFGITQKASVDWSFTDKRVYGQQQFPIAIVRGQATVVGKATNAQFNMLLFCDLFFGLTPDTPTVGSVTAAAAEAVIINGNYSPQHAFFIDDLGVQYADTGNHFQRFSSPVGAGEYAIVGGIYAFTGDDAGKEVIVSYRYGDPTRGRRVTIVNSQQGITPTWKANFFHETSPGQAGAGSTDQPFSMHLTACVSSKLTLPNSAVDSWTIPELDFEACADEDGNVGFLSMIQI